MITNAQPGLLNPMAIPRETTVPLPASWSEATETSPVVSREAHLVVSLMAMKPGQRGIISHLDQSDPDRLRKLLSLGMYPGSRVHLRWSSPAFVVQIGFSQFAVDERIAEALFVRLDA